MKASDYGKGYQYAHDFEEKVTAMPCLPANLVGREYYQPLGDGFEKELRARLDDLKRRKAEMRQPE